MEKIKNRLMVLESRTREANAKTCVHVQTTDSMSGTTPGRMRGVDKERLVINEMIKMERFNKRW